MPFDHLGVKIGEMEGLSSQLKQKAGDIEELLSQVQNQINSIGASWEGQASNQFINLMGQWTNDLKSMHDNLEAMAGKLDQAVKNYRETEEANARMFQID